MDTNTYTIGYVFWSLVGIVALITIAVRLSLPKPGEAMACILSLIACFAGVFFSLWLAGFLLGPPSPPVDSGIVILGLLVAIAIFLAGFVGLFSMMFALWHDIRKITKKR